MASPPPPSTPSAASETSTVEGGGAVTGDGGDHIHSFNLNESTFLASLMPKKEIGADRFLESHPEYDGRGVLIAIFGISTLLSVFILVFDVNGDPAAAGLQVTSDGKPKILDIIDCTGCGDIDTSKVVKADADGNITGASGAQLVVNPSWKNPSGEWHVGYKLVYELFLKKPDSLTSRIKKERRKKWDEKNREAISETLKQLNLFDKKYSRTDDINLKYAREDLQNRLDFLKKHADSYDDKGPFIDAVVWNDGAVWRVAIDTQSFEGDSKLGKLAEFVPLTNYRFERQYGIFSKLDVCSFVTNVYNEGNLLSIVTDCSNHGTHVAGIAAAFHHKVVDKHRLVFISSAGNDGPALSTVTSPGGTCSSIIGVGAYVSPSMAAGAHCVVEPPSEGLEYTWSSRGPTVDGNLGVCVSAPGGAVAPVPTWTLQRRMLMNGTSMASPSACGGVALLISAMKAEGITVSPYMIRKALENTTISVGELPEDKLSTGHGLMQVDSFYKVQISQEGKSRLNLRGIYLREASACKQASEWTVQVEPKFHEDASNLEQLVQFEECIQLHSSEKSVVQTPEYLLLNNNGRSFNIIVDPTDLGDGLHYYEVYGHVERRFIEVPHWATWFEATMQTSGFDTARKFLINTVQICPLRKPIKWNKDVTFSSPSLKSFSFLVEGGLMMELAIAQFWLSGVGSHESTTVNFKDWFPKQKEEVRVHMWKRDFIWHANVEILEKLNQLVLFIEMKLKQEYPKYTPLLSKILEGFLTGGADEDNIDRYEEIINAAIDVVNSVDKVELLKYFSVKSDPEDIEAEKIRKKMEATHDQLAEAFYQKGLALAKIESIKGRNINRSATASSDEVSDGKTEDSASHPSDQPDKFEENFKELKKWVDVKLLKYRMLVVVRERRCKRLGTALKVLNDKIQDDPEAPKKKLYELKIELLDEIGWTHLASYERRWMYVRFPPSLPPF
ncbi:hypothetical protein QJS10_CPA06g00318 [Acorus calamus]|uniref:Tripeptidyl-peptidase II n=1 Tax=Acorus calamus TaxID=4465 RepID=A0AAV9EHY9_ACOCL|nr:hypothetical protein QJS10_CPA06g00318 [Acorus calamus]